MSATIQIEFLKDYFFPEGNTKRKGHKTIMDAARAIPLIKAGFAREFKAYDLREQARNEMAAIMMQREREIIDPQPKMSWWQKLKHLFFNK